MDKNIKQLKQELIDYSIVKNEKEMVFVGEDNVLLEDNAKGRVIADPCPNSKVEALYKIEPSVFGEAEACSDELAIDSKSTGSPSSIGLPSAQTPKHTSTPPKIADGYSLQVKWSEEISQFMLKNYAKFIDSVGPLKKFRTKKLMWAHIAAIIGKKFSFRVNGCQVESRFKCVKKQIKKATENKNTSEAVQEDIDEIVRRDESIFEEVGVSPGRIYKQTDTFSIRPPSSCSPPPPPVEIAAHSTAERSSVRARRFATMTSASPSSSPSRSPSPSQTPPVTQSDDEEVTPIRERKTSEMILHEQWLAQKEDFYRRKEENRMEHIRLKNEQRRLRNEQRAKYDEKKLEIFKELARSMQSKVKNNIKK